ncbi:MAG TPA: hypothetical protein VGO47_03895 [Chlamydiales bacterium]|jgi:hypothetical protein|nr:hypothetical protein [Chlamydiales bacterium]
MIKSCTNVAALESTTANFVPPEDHPIHPENQSFSEALHRDPVALLRSVVNSIRNSQLRRHHFKRAICSVNEEAADNNKLSESLVPIRDCPTRWGSTYLMISRGLVLQKVSIFLDI